MMREATTARPWTPEEQRQLFNVFFSASSAVCPVCANEVCIMMSCLKERITLLLRCEGCGNRASVSRGLNSISPPAAAVLGNAPRQEAVS